MSDHQPLHLIQFTDSHLCHAPEGRLLGVATQRCLDAVLERARADHWPPDLVLATGDLAQEPTRAAYQRLNGRFDDLGVPVYWIPGNHDDPALMREHLAGGAVSNEKCVHAGNWQIILLDSTNRGQVGGQLSDAELERLERCLAQEPERHALVCLHHHPVDMNCAWMEPIGLGNRDDLFAVLDRHPQVRGLLWGHVHQEWQQQRNGVTMMSTPSTCFQFMPDSKDFALDDRLPGYRHIVLHPDGSLESRVERLVDFDIELDPSATGY